MNKVMLKDIKFKNNGLVPVIIQDFKSKEVLMLAFMNKLALRLTLKTKRVHFWSRSRQKLWCKGETSGHFQIVKEIYYDCDSDAVLIKVNQLGGAACHTGHRSCFFKKATKNSVKECGKKVFDPKEVYKK